jgi:hypothetical protein
MVKQLLKKHVWDHWAAVHAMRDESEGTLSSQPFIVYTTAAVSLTYLHYYGQADVFVKTFGKYFEGSPYINLYGQLFWSGSCLVGYVLDWGLWSFHQRFLSPPVDLRHPLCWRISFRFSVFVY